MATETDLTFERSLMTATHRQVKATCPEINLRKDAWVWHAGRDLWEFHGPNDFYWHGRANSAYHARSQGWIAWLRNRERKAA